MEKYAFRTCSGWTAIVLARCLATPASGGYRGFETIFEEAAAAAGAIIASPTASGRACRLEILPNEAPLLIGAAQPIRSSDPGHTPPSGVFDLSLSDQLVRERRLCMNEEFDGSPPAWPA